MWRTQRTTEDNGGNTHNFPIITGFTALIFPIFPEGLLGNWSLTKRDPTISPLPPPSPPPFCHPHLSEAVQVLGDSGA